jgi:ADP-ribose pyrophosphatase YjhB (NUDIX family)
VRALLKGAYQLLRVYWFVVRPVSIGVRLLMVRENQVLLVRHSYQEAWFLPGGGVKRGETLEQAARREAQEECGARINQLELGGAYTHFYEYRNDHVVLFITKEFELSGKMDFEIDQVAFFPLDNLPEDISPGSRRRIKEYAGGELSRSGVW